MADRAPVPRRAAGDCGFRRLLALLDPSRPVAVQTHDFPDLDAVASAWGLCLLLGRRGMVARPCHRGAIRSRSLNRLVSELRIDLVEAPGPEEGRQLIIVDGSPANGNVNVLEGELLGVVDHHRRDRNPAAPFVDIEPELASCSTLIHGYWLSEGETVPADLATALLAGIQSDTDFLSRRASPADFAAYTSLFSCGDFDQASRIVRTVFDLRELDLVIRALEGAVTRSGMLFAWIPGPCGQEVLGVLAEFLLRTEELDLVIVAERGDRGEAGEGIHLSARSKDPALSAFTVLSKAIAGIGSGGGHSHSAGGFIPRDAFPGPDALRERFLSQTTRS